MHKFVALGYLVVGFCINRMLVHVLHYVSGVWGCTKCSIYHKFNQHTITINIFILVYHWGVVILLPLIVFSIVYYYYYFLSYIIVILWKFNYAACNYEDGRLALKNECSSSYKAWMIIIITTVCMCTFIIINAYWLSWWVCHANLKSFLTFLKPAQPINTIGLLAHCLLAIAHI